MPAAVISWPHRLIRPESIGSSRLTQRSSVDLPDPDAPIRQTTSWAATDRLMPLRTSLAPNDLCRSSILIASPSATGPGPALTGCPRWRSRGALRWRSRGALRWRSRGVPDGAQGRALWCRSWGGSGEAAPAVPLDQPVGEARERDGEDQEQDRGHREAGEVEHLLAIDFGRLVGLDGPQHADQRR